jgi:hypothetical protein
VADQSALATLTNIFTAPTEAFAAIKEQPRPWLPLLLLIVVYGVVSFTYLNAVDLAWFFDRAMQNAPNLTEAQREQAVETQANMSPNLLGSFASVSAAVAFLVLVAIVALYFTGVSAAMNAGIRFKQWFGLLAWCAMPVLLGLVASIANVLFSDARFMPQEALNPLAFGNLLGIDSEGAPFTQRALLSLDVTAIWCLVLQVLGFQAWTGRSTLVAAAVALAPILVVFVIVGAFA